MLPSTPCAATYRIRPLSSFRRGDRLASLQDNFSGVICPGNTLVVETIRRPAPTESASTAIDALKTGVFQGHQDADVLLSEAEADGFQRVARGSHLFFATRELVVPSLVVRRGRVEDYDDLAPIIAHQAPSAAQLMRGERGLAQVLDASDEDFVSFVAESGGRAVGCVMVTSEVDIGALHAAYDLSGFASLRVTPETAQRDATATARRRRRSAEDAPALVTARADEVKQLIDSTSSRSADGSAGIAAVITALNAKGSAWGYEGPAGLRLGDHLALRGGMVGALRENPGATTSADELWRMITRGCDLGPLLAAAAVKEGSASPPIIVLVTAANGETDALQMAKTAGAAAAALLQLPVLDLPAALREAAAAHAAAVDAAHEKARKAEDERAKRASKAGGGAGHTPLERQASTGGAAGFEPRATEPLAVLIKALRKLSFARGAVVVGLTLRDQEASQSILSAMSDAGLPPALILHLCDVQTPAGGLDLCLGEDLNGEALPEDALGIATGLLQCGGPLPPVELVEGDSARLRERERAISSASSLSLCVPSFQPHDDEGAVRDNVVSALIRGGLLQDELDLGSTGTVRSSQAAAIAWPTAGHSNAFGVALFALAPQHHCRAQDLLAGAFDAFPDRRFAVFTQACAMPHAHFLRRFVHAPPLSALTLQHSLYVCARESLLAPALLGARRATDSDRYIIRQMIKQSSGGDVDNVDQAMEAVAAALANNDLPLVSETETEDEQAANARSTCFVIELASSPIGVVVLTSDGCEPRDTAALSQTYRLPVGLDSFLRVQVAVVVPPYLQHAHTALDMAAALMSTDVGPDPVLLYLHALQTGAESRRHQLPPVVAAHMQAVEPLVLPVSVAADRVPVEPGMALYVRPAGTVDPRATAHHRIVVVGATVTALHTLATLVFSQRLRAPHITVVRPPYAPGSAVGGGEEADALLERIVDGHLLQIVTGEVTRIDRPARVLHVSGAGGIAIPYDCLVLAPELCEDSLRKLSSGGQAELPSGVFSLPAVTSESQAQLDQRLNELQSTFKTHAAPGAASGEQSQQGDIIVYGASLLALETVADLISRGIPASRIVLVEPPPAVPVPDEEMAVTAGAVRSLLSTAADANGCGGPRVTEAARFPSQHVHALLTRAGVRLHTGTLVSARQVPRQIEPPLSRTNSRASSFSRASSHRVLRANLADSSADVSGVAASAAATPTSAGGSSAASVSGAAAAAGSGGPVVMELVAAFQLVAAGGTTRRRRSIAVTSMSAESGAGVTKFPAALLLTCHAREVPPSVAAAANDQGLVFDSRLVVDHAFITNDPCIMAGGAACKFSRRYGTYLPMESVDPREAGRAMGAALVRKLTQLDGDGAGASDTAQPSHAQLPRYLRPRVRTALLPGGLYYLHASLPQPTPTVPIATSTGAQAEPPREMITCVVSQGGDKADAPHDCAGGPHNREHPTVARRWSVQGIQSRRESMKYPPIIHIASTAHFSFLPAPAPCSRISLDAFGRLAELEFLGTDSLDGRIGDLPRLVGLHASYLKLAPAAGGTETRPAGLASVPADLTEHLLAPWARALMLRELLPGASVAGDGAEGSTGGGAAWWGAATRETHSGSEADVPSTVAAFTRQRADLLPMYHTADPPRL